MRYIKTYYPSILAFILLWIIGCNAYGQKTDSTMNVLKRIQLPLIQYDVAPPITNYDFKFNNRHAISYAQSLYILDSLKERIEELENKSYTDSIVAKLYSQEFIKLVTTKIKYAYQFGLMDKWVRANLRAAKLRRYNKLLKEAE